MLELDIADAGECDTFAFIGGNPNLGLFGAPFFRVMRGLDAHARVESADGKLFDVEYIRACARTLNVRGGEP